MVTIPSSYSYGWWGCVFYSMSRMEDPSHFPLIGDTSANAWDGLQYYCFGRAELYESGVGGGVVLRHASRADLVFADGHSEACSLSHLVNRCGFNVTSVISLN